MMPERQIPIHTFMTQSGEPGDILKAIITARRLIRDTYQSGASKGTAAKDVVEAVAPALDDAGIVVTMEMDGDLQFLSGKGSMIVTGTVVVWFTSVKDGTSIIARVPSIGMAPNFKSAGAFLTLAMKNGFLNVFSMHDAAHESADPPEMSVTLTAHWKHLQTCETPDDLLKATAHSTSHALKSSEHAKARSMWDDRKETLLALGAMTTHQWNEARRRRAREQKEDEERHASLDRESSRALASAPIDPDEFERKRAPKRGKK